MGFLSIIQLIDAAIPIVSNLVVAIKGNTGTNITVYLSEADADFATNLTQLQAWIKTKNLGAATTATPAQPPAQG